MAYTVNILINSRNWYDSRLTVSDSVVFQNVNYADGDDRSVNVVRHRFMQDWARRIIPNSVRQGLGLTDPAGASDDIIVTQGYAVVGGRFVDIPAGTFNAATESLTGSKFYYLTIKVTDFTEGDTRLSSAGAAFLVAQPLTSPTYVKNHNELILAKFYYTGTVFNQWEDYTAEQEWQASVISPVSVRPGLTTGATSVLLRAGDNERINNLGIETDKTRFYLNAVFNDQVGSTEVKIINKSNRMFTRDLTDTVYYGHDMLDLMIGGSTYIDSAGNQTNVGTLNSHTIQGGTDVFVMRNTTDTLTSKTLTSPIITGGTLNSGGVLTVDSTELNQLAGVLVGLNNPGDIVTTTDIQTLTLKTLTTPILSSFYQDAGQTKLITVPSTASDTLVAEEEVQWLSSKTLTTLKIGESGATHGVGNYGTISLPVLSINPTYSILSAASDEFVMKAQAQILTSKTLTTPTIGSFTNANHTHAASGSSGGLISFDNLSGLPVGIAQGGTANTTFSTTANGVVIADGTAAMVSVPTSSLSRLLVSGSDNPSWQSPRININYSGDLSGTTDFADMTSGGDWNLTLNPAISGAHNHSLSDSGDQDKQYTAQSLYWGDNGTNVSVSLTNKAYVQANFTSTAGAELYFAIPMLMGKRLQTVQLVGRVSSGSSHLLFGQLVGYSPTGSAGKGTSESNTWSSTVLTKSYDCNTIQTAVTDAYYFMLRNDVTTGSTIQIVSVVCKFSD